MNRATLVSLLLCLVSAFIGDATADQAPTVAHGGETQAQTGRGMNSGRGMSSFSRFFSSFTKHPDENPAVGTTESFLNAPKNINLAARRSAVPIALLETEPAALVRSTTEDIGSNSKQNFASSTTNSTAAVVSDSRSATRQHWHAEARVATNKAEDVFPAAATERPANQSTHRVGSNRTFLGGRGFSARRTAELDDVSNTAHAHSDNQALPDEDEKAAVRPVFHMHSPDKSESLVHSHAPGAVVKDRSSDAEDNRAAVHKRAQIARGKRATMAANTTTIGSWQLSVGGESDGRVAAHEARDSSSQSRVANASGGHNASSNLSTFGTLERVVPPRVSNETFVAEAEQLAKSSISTHGNSSMEDASPLAPEMEAAEKVAGSVGAGGFQSESQHTSRAETFAAMHARALAKRRIAANASSQHTVANMCQRGASDCKSMCRWLKLTESDFNDAVGRDPTRSSCPLLEQSLRAFGYVKADEREVGQVGDRLDCLLDIVHLNVVEAETAIYVDQLSRCMEGVTGETREVFRVPLGLVTDEIRDWQTEQSLHAAATAAAEKLELAMAGGQVALESKQNVSQSLVELGSAISTAQNITGHYLTDDIRAAQVLMESLEPIPAVRKALEEATAFGLSALETKRDSDQAAAWLKVSMEQASELNMQQHVADAQEVLDKIMHLKAAQQGLHEAIMNANVSLRTVLKVSQAVALLNETIERAQEFDAQDEVPVGVHLRQRLTRTQDVLEELQAAVVLGRRALRDGTDEDVAMHHLETAIGSCHELDLGRRCANAEHVFGEIKGATNAEANLAATVEHARAILNANLTSGANSNEGDAIALLTAAIRQAEDAGQFTGLDEARHLLERLQGIRAALLSLQHAMAQADADFGNHTDLSRSINALEAAISEIAALGLTGGTGRARDLLEELRSVQGTRDELKSAMNDTIAAVRAEAGEDAAVSRAHSAVVAAEKLNLTEARPAEERLEKVQAFLSARREMHEVLGGGRTGRGRAGRSSNTSQGAGGAAAAAAARGNASAAPRHAEAAGEIGEAGGGGSGGAGEAGGDEGAEADREAAEERPDIFGGDEAWSGAEDQAEAGGAEGGEKPDIFGSNEDFEEHIQAVNRSIARARELGVTDPELEEQLARLQSAKNVWEDLQRAKKLGRAALSSLDGIEDAIIVLSAAINVAEVEELPGIHSAKSLVERLRGISPARDELDAAVGEANVTLLTTVGIQNALIRLQRAIYAGEDAGLFEDSRRMNTARAVLQHVSTIKEARVNLEAAIAEGTIALRIEAGEGPAIEGLELAIEQARIAGLHREVSAAQELLSQLRYMQREQDLVETSVAEE